MKTAFLFPGQGSQAVGMGADLDGGLPRAREWFDRAGAMLPFDLRKICFEGPEEELKQTRVTQPALFVHSTLIASLLVERGVVPHAVAGHSVGEYAALVAAGALDFEAGLELVALRGELMQHAGEDRPGTMAALLGLEAGRVEEICRQASSGGEVVVAANLNAPGQIVISGDRAAVLRAMEAAKEAGARRAVQLVVSGAFHSPLMAPAGETLAEAVRRAPMRDAEIPVYLNVTARPTTDAGEIRRRLIEQLTSPVRWEDTLRAMAEGGVRRYIETGPGRVLQGLAKRILGEAEITGVGTLEQLESFAAE